MENDAYSICIAPMMDWTDPHCRYFHRLLAPHARLYTEMVTTGAVLKSDRARLLGFDAAEHPVALQLGGHEPADLAAAARIGVDFGYPLPAASEAAPQIGLGVPGSGGSRESAVVETQGTLARRPQDLTALLTLVLTQCTCQALTAVVRTALGARPLNEGFATRQRRL
jgi:hypothetical protein